jgi:ParB-like chromosome segregation protein Spo0J/DNA modification methylase
MTAEPKPTRIRVKELKMVRADQLVPAPKNFRMHSQHQRRVFQGVLEEVGFAGAVVTRELDDGRFEIIDGHLRAEEGSNDPIPVLVTDLTEAEAAKVLATYDAIGGLADIDVDVLKDLATEIEFENVDLDQMVDDMITQYSADPALAAADAARATLTGRFVVPPFSVLDARQGYWQERKRAWLALGIQSELGRGQQTLESGDSEASGPARVFGQDLMRGEHTVGQTTKGLLSKATERKGYGPDYDTSNGENAWGGSGTSIFDPVLCELVYRWFCPPGGSVLDPFAGGSVRGIVAATLRHPYTGIDLSGRQIEANRAQWDDIGVTNTPRIPPDQPLADPLALTPVEEHGGHMVKRDDLFGIAGARGGKVRTCWALAQGAPGLVTAGSRSSPQVNIVARIAAELGIPCRVQTPSGALGPEVTGAQDAGAEVVQHKPGYNTVIVARARKDAAATGWTEIPFGMECQEAVDQTRQQVRNLPAQVSRLVVPVGSGMSLAGILHGLRDAQRTLPVLGVQVGADPTKRLDRFAPEGWRDMVELVEAGLAYEQRAPVDRLGDLALDPIYEAKCLPFLQAGDLLWVVGIRPSESTPDTGAVAPSWIEGDAADLEQLLLGGYQADLVFTCPPYFDLEVYSDNPLDLSTMGWDQFLASYRLCIARACVRLRPDRFACIVVGDVRDSRGLYRNFVAETISAFQDAGLALYNEAVLVTAVGSLPLRVGKQFQAGRKLSKTHQNLLVFYKGDPAQIKGTFGPVEVGELPHSEEE